LNRQISKDTSEDFDCEVQAKRVAFFEFYDAIQFDSATISVPILVVFEKRSDLLNMI
jgi:hypothetical protein